ncbi:MAG: hypothetical protein CVT83_06695 [Alphaproteobacteria bacterium HGW-Alphaproteobacteria-5]|nr:MAG: hypothetical protein CVT83_06695 [Alphaproteobacteria bacterium HGW-Alphaproteobacteria-5]
MARATGARAQMALAFESVYGTPPASGYTKMPFATATLGSDQPLLNSELLGYGRDPLAPVKDAVTADGDVVVPIDAEAFGHWLKAAFGAPTTAGVVAATGSITFAANPIVNERVMINGTTFTFVASGAVGDEVNIGATLAASMTALAAALNASVVSGVALATYTGTATALTIEHDTAGTAGNSFTLGADTATVSGATLTGGANSHTFTSGSWTLPSMSIEIGMPEVPRYAMYSGCVLDKIGWQLQRSGLLTATVSLVAQDETVAASTAAGTLAEVALQRFGHFNGAITRNGAALGNIVSADVAYTNNLDRIETIRSDGQIDGADMGMAALTGKIDVRFADQTLVDQAIDGTAAELVFAYSLSASASFTFTAHAVYLPRPRIAIAGPQGVQASFDWQAALAASPARMCTAVLVNSIASYA